MVAIIRAKRQVHDSLRGLANRLALRLPASDPEPARTLARVPGAGAVDINVVSVGEQCLSIQRDSATDIGERRSQGQHCIIRVRRDSEKWRGKRCSRHGD